MVHVTDDGVFDAPIDKVWKYISDDMMHQHKSFKVTSTEEQGNAMIMHADVANPGGMGTHKETWKMVVNSPKGFELEYLAGPMKGSRHTHTYTPVGNKTRVEVSGEFRAEGMDDESTKRAVLAYFAEVFEEDQAAMKKMQ